MSEDYPEVDVVLLKKKSDPLRDRDEIRKWLILDCPWCEKTHNHGAGTEDEDPLDTVGLRQSHCPESMDTTYRLNPLPVEDNYLDCINRMGEFEKHDSNLLFEWDQSNGVLNIAKMAFFFAKNSPFSEIYFDKLGFGVNSGSAWTIRVTDVYTMFPENLDSIVDETLDKVVEEFDAINSYCWQQTGSFDPQEKQPDDLPEITIRLMVTPTLEMREKLETA